MYRSIINDIHSSSTGDGYRIEQTRTEMAATSATHIQELNLTTPLLIDQALRALQEATHTQPDFVAVLTERSQMLLWS